MTYAEKLKDPRWQKKRLSVLERDNWTCQMCYDSKETLHVHHKSYHGEPWESPSKELVALCARCHQFISEKGSPDYDDIFDVGKLTNGGLLIVSVGGFFSYYDGVSNVVFNEEEDIICFRRASDIAHEQLCKLQEENA